MRVDTYSQAFDLLPLTRPGCGLPDFKKYARELSDGSLLISGKLLPALFNADPSSMFGVDYAHHAFRSSDLDEAIRPYRIPPERRL